MAPSGKKSLKSSVAIAKLVTKLKSSDSIADLIQRLDENSINHLVGVIANLMHKFFILPRKLFFDLVLLLF